MDGNLRVNFVFLDDDNLDGRMKFRGSLMMKEH